MHFLHGPTWAWHIVYTYAVACHWIQRNAVPNDNDEFNKRRTNAIKSYRKKEQ